MIKAKEHCCEEAALGMGDAYIPCNKPATKIIRTNHAGEPDLRMCDFCADHSVRNRGMTLVGPYVSPPSYDYWRAAVAGQKPKMFVDDPQLGFYRKSVNERNAKGNSRRVGWTPVAIYPVSGGIAAMVGETTILNKRDEINELWTWVAGNAISEEWFRAVERGEPWPDAHDSGKNKSAEPIKDLSQDGETGKPLALADVKELPEQKLARELAEAKAGVSKYDKIDSDTMAGQALSLKNEITTLAGKLNKIRETLVRPHVDAQAEINGRLNPIINDAKAQTVLLRDRMGAWEDFKRVQAAKAQALADAKDREHADKVRTAEAANEPPPPAPKPVAPNAPPPSSQIAAAVGRKANVSVKKFVTSIDLDKAFAQFRNEPAVYACLIALTQRAVDAGLQVDGATIDERSVVR